MSGVLSGKARMSALVAALALVLAPLAGPVSPASAAGKPGVSLSRSEAGTGGSITVTGNGWRPKTLLMMLICGQAVPSRG